MQFQASSDICIVTRADDIVHWWGVVIIYFISLPAIPRYLRKSTAIMLRCGFSMSRMCFGTRGLCSIEKATKAKPILTSPHTYISFFLFEHIKNPSSVADALRDKLMTQNFRGTIYVAPEVKHLKLFD